jgi:mono/diheme cytochrome c family protein
MPEARKPNREVRRFALRLMALVAVFGSACVGPNRARVEDELHQTRAQAGRIWYEQYCMRCHGPGGAPGSAVYRDSKQPVDLRGYVQRHGGEFPTADWIAAVSNPNPAGGHAEVWQEIRRTQAGTSFPDIGAHGILAVIADYIRSVQTK